MVTTVLDLSYLALTTWKNRSASSLSNGKKPTSSQMSSTRST